MNNRTQLFYRCICLSLMPVMICSIKEANANNGQAIITVRVKEKSNVTYISPGVKRKSLTSGKRHKLPFTSEITLTAGELNYSCNNGKNTRKLDKPRSKPYPVNVLCKGYAATQGADTYFTDAGYKSDNPMEPYVISPRIGFLRPDDIAPEIRWNSIPGSYQYEVYICQELQIATKNSLTEPNQICRENQILLGSHKVMSLSTNHTVDEYRIPYPFGEKIKEGNSYEFFVKATILKDGIPKEIFSHDKKKFKGEVRLLNPEKYDATIKPIIEHSRSELDCSQLFCVSDTYVGYELYTDAIKELENSSQDDELNQIYNQIGLPLVSGRKRGSANNIR